MIYKPDVNPPDATVDLLELTKKGGKVRNLRMVTADQETKLQPAIRQDNKRIKTGHGPSLLPWMGTFKKKDEYEDKDWQIKDSKNFMTLTKNSD